MSVTQFSTQILRLIDEYRAKIAMCVDLNDLYVEVGSLRSGLQFSEGQLQDHMQSNPKNVQSLENASVKPNTVQSKTNEFSEHQDGNYKLINPVGAAGKLSSIDSKADEILALLRQLSMTMSSRELHISPKGSGQNDNDDERSELDRSGDLNEVISTSDNFHRGERGFAVHEMQCEGIVEYGVNRSICLVSFWGLPKLWFAM